MSKVSNNINLKMIGVALFQAVFSGIIYILLLALFNGEFNIDGIFTSSNALQLSLYIFIFFVVFIVMEYVKVKKQK